MTSRRSVATATVLLGCLVAAAPAASAAAPAGQDEPPPLPTNLRYGPTSWTADGTEMTVMAPRGWTLVLTPEGQARFNAPARTDVLTMAEREEGALRQQMRDKVAALQGTPGLRIVDTHVHGEGDSVRGELRYVWTAPGGVPRWVDYRYQGDDVYAVAGRVVDRTGLMAVLDNASSTGGCGGG